MRFLPSARQTEMEQFISLADVLGLHENYEIMVTDEIISLQQQRTEARAAKDFVTADRIRDQLTAMGVEVTMHPYGG
jgi:cysteinyl-tRNA synthetase